MVDWIWLNHTVSVWADTIEELQAELKAVDERWPEHTLTLSTINGTVDGRMVAVLWRKEKGEHKYEDHA